MTKVAHQSCPMCGQPTHGTMPIKVGENYQAGCGRCYARHSGASFVKTGETLCANGHPLAAPAPRPMWIMCELCHGPNGQMSLL